MMTSGLNSLRLGPLSGGIVGCGVVVVVGRVTTLREGSRVDLADRKTHFEFGENWRDYSKTIDATRIESAVQGLRKLFPEGIAGKTFFDIGCGSGLHSLAALS